MKLLVTAVALLLASTVVTANSTEPHLTSKKKEADPKNELKKDMSKSKNFHSVKKWKVSIEFKNGKTIHKFITARENSKLSAMDTAFTEAEKYLETLRTLRKVVGYTVTPVSQNSYVLLAGK